MLAQNNKEPSPGDLQDQVSESEHTSSNLDLQEEADGGIDDATRKIGKWTVEEDNLLRKYVPLFGEKQWRRISEHIKGRTSIQCLHRWTKILKPGLVKGPWTAEEDQKLLAWVRTEGATKWAQCANFINGRSGKQCRERWFNNLNPDVKKGNWSKEEDELIFGLYQKYGSSWSKIAKFINGRTENAIKNRFYSTLRKLTSDKKKEQFEKHEDLCLGEEKPANESTPQKEFIEIPGAPQPPNALYLLLNGKTSAAQGQEDMKKENSVAGIDKNTKTTANQSEKPQQAFNINGEKFIVLRDAKFNEKNIQEAASKLLNTEIEDNDTAFEDFLGNLQLNLKDDFLKKEFDPNEKPEDISHLDGLQRKILNFCQNNIKDLAESFKMIDTSKTSTNASEISASDVRTRLAPQMQTSNMTVESTNVPHDNMRGLMMMAPNVNMAAQKGFALRGTQLPQMNIKSGNSPVKVPSPKGFSLYNPINPATKLSRNPSDNSSDNKSQNAGTMPLKMPAMNPMMTFEDQVRMNVEKSMNMPFMMTQAQAQAQAQVQVQTGFPGFAGFNGFNANMVGFNQRLPNGEMSDSEKRMAFLFQQLFSLEMLLSKTRNDLIQYESSLDNGSKKGANLENIKMEEIDMDLLRGQNRNLNVPRPLVQLNSEFDQLLKKKRVE